MEKKFTEITFNQDPDMENRHKSWFENPPAEVALGMTVEELLAPSKRKKSRTAPPRPQQSYILFRKNFMALNEAMEFGNVSSASRAEWRKAPPVVREFFE
ncbi:7688_t:CDS:1, partial [Paraglomus occultum]